MKKSELLVEVSEDKQVARFNYGSEIIKHQQSTSGNERGSQENEMANNYEGKGDYKEGNSENWEDMGDKSKEK